MAEPVIDARCQFTANATPRNREAWQRALEFLARHLKA
jgi:hypothetical protein